MKTKECNIVQDLLPNYIEGLVSRETSEFVKKHIDECEFCKNKYLSLIHISEPTRRS